MSPSDEQVITTSYALNITQKRLNMQFSQPLQNLSLRPDQAVAMAKVVLSCARELDPDSVKGCTWPGMDEPIKKEPIADAPAGGKPS